ncbi:hypothetical protein GDO86_007951 [Hymenochirus boettgeri]|uniref:Uncharacterized protein n=1 Tax=Hymenochirus boettgeri TaxID=247094 RepID=A0A8T2J176_9PIPI|nr:hypothetical protein GDO86_007951 [Hymenochirus boettgeri]
MSGPYTAGSSLCSRQFHLHISLLCSHICIGT